MRHDSTPRNSGQDDLIDFACSDTYRDHYAAQGLTYAAGRYKQKTPLRLPVWSDETDALYDKKRELEREVRLLRLENDQLLRHARVRDRAPIMPAPGGHSATVFQGVVHCDASGEGTDAPG